MVVLNILMYHLFRPRINNYNIILIFNYIFQGIEDACNGPPAITTDLTDTTSQTIHSTTNDDRSSTSDNQHPETSDATVTTASTIHTTNDGNYGYILIK
jgi:hypothetical protein